MTYVIYIPKYTLFLDICQEYIAPNKKKRPALWAWPWDLQPASSAHRPWAWGGQVERFLRGRAFRRGAPARGYGGLGDRADGHGAILSHPAAVAEIHRKPQQVQQGAQAEDQTAQQVWGDSSARPAPA